MQLPKARSQQGPGEAVTQPSPHGGSVLKVFPKGIARTIPGATVNTAELCTWLLHPSLTSGPGM